MSTREDLKTKFTKGYKIKKADYDDLFDSISFHTDTVTGVFYSDLLNKPTSFNPTEHTHAISGVTNLQTTLNTKITSAGPLDWSGITNIPASAFSQGDIPEPATTVTTETFGASGTVGTATTYAREDHQHPLILGTASNFNITISPLMPTGGVNGDIWIQYIP